MRVSIVHVKICYCSLCFVASFYFEQSSENNQQAMHLKIVVK